MASQEFEERRKTLRAPCCYPVRYQASQGEFTANVIDLGYGGMRILGGRSLSVDEQLRVTPADGGEPVSARVVWSEASGQEYESGLVYLGPLPELNRSWVKSALRGLGFEGNRVHERRQYVRRPTELSGKLWPGQEAQPVSLVDVSLGGALLRSLEPHSTLAAGTEVRLELSLDGLNEPLNGKIVYQREELIGLAFQEDRLTRAQTRLLEGYLRALG